jgi:hypothetical protein
MLYRDDLRGSEHDCDIIRVEDRTDPLSRSEIDTFLGFGLPQQPVMGVS